MVNSVCIAVINDVIVFGDEEGVSSARLLFSVPDIPRPLPSVCRSVANLAAVLGGVGGRLWSADRVPVVLDLGIGDPGLDVAMGGGAFFLLDWNVRKIDHSDSNCTESNSEERGEYSRSAASNMVSILRSA